MSTTESKLMQGTVLSVARNCSSTERKFNPVKEPHDVISESTFVSGDRCTFELISEGDILPYRSQFLRQL
jgi:hypothetical protein